MVPDAIETFKSAKNVRVESYFEWEREPLDENFFVPAVRHGVRRLELKSNNSSLTRFTPANATATLSFGFADPTAGGDHGLFGFNCEIGPDFLAQVRQVRLLHIGFELLNSHFTGRSKQNVEAKVFEK